MRVRETNDAIVHCCLAAELFLGILQVLPLRTTAAILLDRRDGWNIRGFSISTIRVMPTIGRGYKSTGWQGRGPPHRAVTRERECGMYIAASSRKKQKRCSAKIIDSLGCGLETFVISYHDNKHEV